MRQRAKLEPQSLQPAPRTCPGPIPGGLCVSVACIPAKQAQLAGVNRAKRTQFHRSVTVPAGEMCETNPIPDRRDTPLFHCSIIPPFQADIDCAEQNPSRPWRESVRNEANSTGAGKDAARGTRERVYRAKQSQFLAVLFEPAKAGTPSRDGSCHILLNRATMVAA